jgi:20S proteasome subunit beta 4
LYWLDEYGSLQNIQYGAHGHGSNFILSILDQGYRPNLTLEEATSLLRDCFQQLRTRYVINSPQPPCIKCVDARGSRLIR